MPLPPGLALNPVTGQISGTPTVPGVYPFTLRVRDSQGNVRDIPQSITVVAYTPPALSGTLAEFANRTVAYSSQLMRSEGTAPFTFSISSGVLPTGVTISSSTGLISGTPTDTNYTDRAITVRVVDAAGSSAQSNQTIRYADVLALSGTLASGTEGAAYSSGFAIAGGHAPFTYNISSGALPAGLVLNSSTGVISGTPAGASATAITVRVVDASGAQTTRSQTLTIASAYTPIGISGSVTNTTQDVITASSFSINPNYAGLSISGGVPPYTYSWARMGGSSAISAAAPSSLATGFIGTLAPGASASAVFRLTVSDGIDSESIDITISVTNVYVPLSFGGSVSNTSQNVSTLSAFSLTPNYGALTVNGGSGTITYSWVRTGGSTAINASTPSALGTAFAGTIAPSGFLSSNFRLTVADAFSSATLDITVAATNTYAALSLSTPLGLATRTVAFSRTLVAAGGIGPFTYTVQSGALPTGLSLASGGAITGTPTDTSYGSRAITFRVVDGYGAIFDYATSLGYQNFPTLSYTASNAMRGAAFTLGAIKAGGHGGGNFSLVGGSLPTGLEVSSFDGTVSGTPTSTSYGAFAPVIRFVDNAGNQVDATLNLQYRDTLVIAGTPTTPAYNGSAYTSGALSASGGASPYTWSISAGALPTGLSINPSTGVISGTPSAIGTFNFTVRVTDNVGFVADAARSIVTAANVSASISPTVVNYTFTNSPAAGTPATRNLNSDSVTGSATGGSGGYTYSWARISGSVDVTANTPAAATTNFAAANVAIGGGKSATFRLTVTDSGGRTGTADIVVTIGYESGL